MMNQDGKILTIDSCDFLCHYAIDLSNRHTGKKTTSWHVCEAADLYTKLVLHYMSTLRFIPTSKFFGPVAEFRVFDLSSAAALARNIFEAYAALYYLAVETVSPEEAEFRKLLWCFHGKYERLRMLENTVPDSQNLERIKQSVAKAKLSLSESKWLSKLTGKRTAEALSGKIAIFDKTASILEHAGISKLYFYSTYKYLSNFVHTTSFSLQQFLEARIDNPKSTMIFNHVANLASGCVALAIRDFSQVNGDHPITDEKVKMMIAIWEEVYRWEQSPYRDFQKT